MYHSGEMWLTVPAFEPRLRASPSGLALGPQPLRASSGFERSPPTSPSAGLMGKPVEDLRPDMVMGILADQHTDVL